MRLQHPAWCNFCRSEGEKSGSMQDSLHFEGRKWYCCEWEIKTLENSINHIASSCVLSCVQMFCDPTDCSPPGFSAHGISQARTLEWVAISFYRGSAWPRDQIHVSFVSTLAGQFFTTEPSVAWGYKSLQSRHAWQRTSLFGITQKEQASPSRKCCFKM